MAASHTGGFGGTLEVAIGGTDVENRAMESSAAHRRQTPPTRDPFSVGAVVIVTLTGPREKFWGAITAITAAGVSVSGVDLNSFDDFVRMLRSHEPATASIVFFPMHRVERIELDCPGSGLPSVGERFVAATRQPLGNVLLQPAAPNILVGFTLEQAQRALVEATVAAFEHDTQRAAEVLGISESELKRWLP
jgi:hypothetical protein